MPAEPPLGPEDLALLERLASRVVAMRLEAPALLALESARPLRVLAAQSLVFFEPLVQAVVPMPEWRRWSALAERPEALDALVRAIEQHVERRGAGKRA